MPLRKSTYDTSEAHAVSSAEVPQKLYWSGVPSLSFQCTPRSPWARVPTSPHPLRRQKHRRGGKKQDEPPLAHGILKENRKGHFLERSFFIDPSIVMPTKIPSQIFRWEKNKKQPFF
jgi:hypothetical protein